MKKIKKKHLFTREQPLIDRDDIKSSEGEDYISVEDIIPQNDLLTDEEEEEMIIMAVNQKPRSCPVDSTIIYYKTDQEFLFASRCVLLNLKDIGNVEIYHTNNMESILSRYKKYKSWF